MSSGRMSGEKYTLAITFRVLAVGLPAITLGISVKKLAAAAPAGAGGATGAGGRDRRQQRHRRRRCRPGRRTGSGGSPGCPCAVVSKIDEAFAFQEKALGLRAHRQQVLAANIANADTPNYKARDFDFASTLKAAMAGRQGGDLPLAQTSSCASFGQWRRCACTPDVPRSLAG